MSHASGSPPATADAPSGETAAQWTTLPSLSIRFTSRPVSRSHTTTRVIEPGRQRPLAVGQERDGAHQPVVGVDPPQLLAGRHVPQPHRAVQRPGQGPPAVGRQGDGPHRRRVADEPPQVPAAGDLQQPHAAVGAGEQHQPAVGRERGGIGLRRRPFERVQVAGVVRQDAGDERRLGERRRVAAPGPGRRTPAGTPAGTRCRRPPAAARGCGTASRTPLNRRRSSSGVSPTSAAAVRRSTSASYRTAACITGSASVTLPPTFSSAAAEPLGVLVHQLRHRLPRAGTGPRPSRRRPWRERRAGSWATWSRTWSALGRMPVTWQLMHDTPASTARSGRRGSLTIAVGPLSMRALLALTSMNPCRPLGRWKMISPPACWNVVVGVAGAERVGEQVAAVGQQVLALDEVLRHGLEVVGPPVGAVRADVPLDQPVVPRHAGAVEPGPGDALLPDVGGRVDASCRSSSPAVVGQLQQVVVERRPRRGGEEPVGPDDRQAGGGVARRRPGTRRCPRRRRRGTRRGGGSTGWRPRAGRAGRCGGPARPGRRGAAWRSAGATTGC